MLLVTSCKKCKSPIALVMTARHVRMVVDAIPTSDGEYVVTGNEYKGSPVVAHRSESSVLGLNKHTCRHKGRR